MGPLSACISKYYHFSIQKIIPIVNGIMARFVNVLIGRENRILNYIKRI